MAAMGYSIGNVNEYNSNEGKAHGRLIASAPDLLDACEALWDNFLSRGGDPDSLLGIQVREAMKKATNE